MDNLFRDRFPLVFEGEKCPETFRVSMDFTSNGLDIVPSFEAKVSLPKELAFEIDRV